MDFQRRQAGSHGVNRWTRLFGAAWELYVHLLVEEVLAGSGRVFEEEQLLEIGASSGQKVCDAIIRYPGRWLLIEAVAKRFTAKTVAQGSLEEFERDLMLGVVEKARQLAASIELLKSAGRKLDPSAQEGDRYTPILVLPGPFPQLPGVMSHVREMLAADDECKALLAERADPLVILAAIDLELLLGTSVAAGRSVAELLDEWQEGELSLVDFRSWATRSPRGADPPAWVLDAGRELMRTSTERMFHRE